MGAPVYLRELRAVVSVDLPPVCTCLVALGTLTYPTPAPCQSIKGKKDPPRKDRALRKARCRASGLSHGRIVALFSVSLSGGTQLTVPAVALANVLAFH